MGKTRWIGGDFVFQGGSWIKGTTEGAWRGQQWRVGLLLQDREPGLNGVISHPLISLKSNFAEVSLIPNPKKGNTKECSNYYTIALISHTSKVMLKILQARLQQYVNRELPDVQAGFRKGTETRDQIAKIHWIIKKARESLKNIYFCFIDCQSFWLCGSQ